MLIRACGIFLYIWMQSSPENTFLATFKYKINLITFTDGNGCLEASISKTSLLKKQRPADRQSYIWNSNSELLFRRLTTTPKKRGEMEIPENIWCELTQLVPVTKTEVLTTTMVHCSYRTMKRFRNMHVWKIYCNNAIAVNYFVIYFLHCALPS